MKRPLRFIIVSLWITLVFSLWSQVVAEFTVHSIVSDQAGNPIPNLTVCLDDLCTDVPTDGQGSFSLTLYEGDRWYALRLFVDDYVYFTDDVYVTQQLSYDGDLINIVPQ
jgi:hypothetical protein